MDMNTLRSGITAVSFVVFVGIVWWAWSARNKSRFEEAARLPFAEDPFSKDERDGDAR